MTMQQHAVFDAGSAKAKATSKLVKAWESKNSKKAAKATGLTLMAVSLSACGSDDSALDAANADLAAAVASLTAATAATAAAESAATAAEAAAAAAEADTAAAEAAAVAAEADTSAAVAAQADAEAAQAEAEAAQAEAEAAQAVAEADAAAAVDAQVTAEGLQAVAEAAQAVAEADTAAAEAAQAAAEADAAAAQADAAAAQAAQAEAEAATAAAEEATAAAEEARDNLQAQVDALLAADTALANRTLDTDGETIAGGDAADFEVIVAGLTSGEDDLTATVTGTGTGELSFTFVDERDNLTLEAADLSSYSSVVVTAGDVDLTAVTLGAGVDISINSGVDLTAAQFLAADSIESNGEGTVTVVVSSAAEAQLVADAVDKVDGVSGDNFTLVNAEGSTATDAEITDIEDDADLAIDVAAASEDPVGSITAAVANVEAEQAQVDAANAELADVLAAAELAEAEAILALVNNELVAEEVGDDAVAAVEEAIDDAETTAVEDLATDDNGANLTAGLATALADSVDDLDAALEADLTIVDDAITDSDAILAAHISDERATAAEDIEDAEEALGEATDALDGTLLISRGEDVAEAEAAQDDAETALDDADDLAEEVQLVAQAIINIDEADATLDATGAFDIDGAEGADEVELFAVEDGVVSLDAEIVSVNAEDSGDYDIAYVDAEDADQTLTVTGSYIDDLVAAYQNVVDATDDAEDAGEDLTAAEALFDAAVVAAGEDEDLDFYDAEDADVGPDAAAEAYEVYEEAVAELDQVTETSADLETAISNYNTLTALDEAIADLGTAVEDADADVEDGASEDDLDAAFDAIVNDLDAEVAGLNVDYLDGFVDEDNDYDYAVNITDDITVDTVDGLDIIDFGEEYTFTTVAADADVDEDAVGDATVLEVLLQQQSDDDGLSAGVAVWIETAAADGSSSSTGGAAFIINNEGEDLALADLDVTSVDGLIITGAYDTGLA